MKCRKIILLLWSVILVVINRNTGVKLRHPHLVPAKLNNLKIAVIVLCKLISCTLDDCYLYLPN